MAKRSFRGKPKKAKGINPGGLMAQMRKTHHLAESELGEVDPAGASMNLATLGMRGVAAHRRPRRSGPTGRRGVPPGSS